MNRTFSYLLLYASILGAVTPLKKIIDQQEREFHGCHHEKLNFERAKTEARYNISFKIRYHKLTLFNINLPIHCFPKYFLWTACRNLYSKKTQNSP